MLHGRTLIGVAVAGLCLASASANAADPSPEAETIAPASPSPATAAYPEVIVVIGERPDGKAELPDLAFDSGRAVDVGESIREIPGVDGVRRSLNSSEPVICGMGWERVKTRLDGVSLHGACAARMDPPVSVISPTAIHRLEVVKGLPSVILGPGGTGGAIELSSDYERGGAEPEPWGARLQTTYDSAANRYGGALQGMGSRRWLDLHAAVYGHRTGDDYKSGDGTRVPAELTAFGGSFSLGARPTERQRLSLSFVDGERRDEDFPSLPMDSVLVSSRIATAAWRLEGGAGAFDGLELRGGYAGVDHSMNNHRKPNYPRMQAETRSDADTFGTRALSRWRLAPALRLAAGLDLEHVTRDATRQRRMSMPMPMGFTDRIWPDVLQWDLGGFAELEFELGEDWRLRLGGRVDYTESDARDADAPSLQMRTVRENYVFYYGPDAAGVDRSETLGSGNLLVVWEAAERLRAYLGSGLTSRTANVTELYFAFAPAPGGFLVGNPTLSPEKKVEILGGVDWASEHVDLSVAFFYAWFEDYILPTVIDERDVNGDGNLDLIRGFVNVDARSYGVEASLLLRAGRYFSVPMSIAYVRGRNTSDSRNLPEIPPLEGRAALRFDSVTDRFSWWTQFGGSFVARQDEIDPLFGENSTPGFVVLHLRGGVELWSGLTLQVGIENLLDREYHEHLTRETALPVGDLAAGDEIPAPGRRVYATMRWEF